MLGAFPTPLGASLLAVSHAAKVPIPRLPGRGPFLRGRIVKAVHAGYEEEDGVLEPMTNVGDKVVFGRYDGTDIEIEGEKYLSIREKDLHLIIAEEDEPLEQSGQ